MEWDFAFGEHRDVEEVDVFRSPEDFDFFLRECGPLRQAARGARYAGSARTEWLVVVEAHVASDGHHGIERDAFLLGNVRRDGAQERHVPVVVRGTRLAERRVAQAGALVGTDHGERVHLAARGTVHEHGAQHGAHLRGDEGIEDDLRFHGVLEDGLSILLDFLDEARFVPFAVLALEHLARKDGLVGGADFGERNLVYAERHAEHFLQFLVDADFMCEPRVFRHGKRAAEIRPVTQVGFVEVVAFGVDLRHHHGEAFHVAQREVAEQFHRIERRERFGEVRVEFLHFALVEDFGVVLEVVPDERARLLVFFRLLHCDVVVGADAQVQHVDGAFVLLFGFVLCGERVLRPRELDFAFHAFLHGEAELVAQPLEIRLAVFVGVAGEPVLLRDGIEFFLRELVEQVVQKPDARDVFGTRRRPRDAHEIALVLVVRSRVVELVHVLEHVEVVLEDVHVVPLVLERECVKDGLPAGTELAERLEAAVEVRIVEAALRCDDLAVPYGHETALEYGFRLDLARDEPVHLFLVEDAHQEDGALLHLVPEYDGGVLADLLAEFLERLFAHFALQLPEGEAQRLEFALLAVDYRVDRAVEVVSLAGAHRLVRVLRLREHEPAELHLEVADVVLEGALGRVLAPRVEGGHDFELGLAPVADVVLFEELLVEFAGELLVDPFERRRHAEAEVAVLEVQRFGKRVVHLFLVDIAFIDHAAEHVAQAFFAALERLFLAFLGALDERVVVERALHRACDECAFGEREVLEFLVEEVLGRDGHALARSRYVELVQVEFQDVFLAEVLFEAQRVDEFLPLRLDAPFFAPEHVLGRLLRERGTALAHVAALDVCEHRAEESLHAEPVVVPVARVFGGDKRVNDVLRDVAVGHVQAVVGVEECSEQFVAVVVVHAGLAGEHLQDGVAVELVVGVAFGEDLEYENVRGDAADDADQRKSRQYLENFYRKGSRGRFRLFSFCVCHKNHQKGPAGCAESVYMLEFSIFCCRPLEKKAKIK